MQDTNQSLPTPTQTQMPPVPQPSRKRLPLIIIAVVVIAALSVGIYFAVQYFVTRAPSTADDGGFNTIADVTALPSLEGELSAADGWEKDGELTIDMPTYQRIVYVNDANCRVTATTQLLPTEDKSDFDLSRSHALSLASVEGGILSDERVIKLKTNREEADFFVAFYNPTSRIDPTQPGGVLVFKDKQSAVVVTRSVSGAVNNNLAKPAGPSDADRTNPTPYDDSKYKDGEIISQVASIPNITFLYQCPTSAFESSVGLESIQQLRVTF